MNSTLLENVNSSLIELGLEPTAAVIGSLDATVRQLSSLYFRNGQQLSSEVDYSGTSNLFIFQTKSLAITGTTTAGSAVITNCLQAANVTTNYVVLNGASSGSPMPPNARVLSINGNSITVDQPALSSGTNVSMVAAQVAYPLPSDYIRIIPDTGWQQSQNWPLIGPANQQQWQDLLNSFAGIGAYVSYRVKGNAIEIFPAQTTPITLSLNYLSSSWIFSPTGAPQSKFLNDSDTAYFPDVLMILGSEKLFKEVNGFDAAYLVRNFDRELGKYKANESGAATQSLVYTEWANGMLGRENIPDGDYSQ